MYNLFYFFVDIEIEISENIYLENFKMLWELRIGNYRKNMRKFFLNKGFIWFCFLILNIFFDVEKMGFNR